MASCSSTTESSEQLAAKCQIGIIAIWLIVLVTEGSLKSSSGSMGALYKDILATLCDYRMQRMMIFALAILFAGFVVSDVCIVSRSSLSWWLGVFMFIWVLRYAQSNVSSTQALALLGGSILGQSARIHFIYRYGGLTAKFYKLCLFLVFIFCVCTWSVNDSHFQYHGHSRWVGCWNNPNIAGLLAGSGFVLASSSGVWALECFACARRQWLRYAFLTLWLITLSELCFRLFQSYSRGAWVATSCGLSYLIFCWDKCRRTTSSRSSIRLFLVLCIVTVLCAFVAWNCYLTKMLPLQRAFSMVNDLDFSSQNRLVAWKGALQIVSEHPWAGVGWNSVGLFYADFYLPAQLSESGAIEMNDHLRLGAMVGVPALFCFGMYVWLLVTQRAQGGGHALGIGAFWVKIGARAGMIVLLIGFWFDGGLFELPTAGTFWVLLELGRDAKVVEPAHQP